MIDLPKASTLAATLLLSLTPTLPAEDWPQFRGPTGQGHSAERGLPLTWSETENVRWRVPVPGRGWSSPSIQGDRIWLTTATDEDRSLRVLSYSKEDGRELLNLEVIRFDEPGPVHKKNSHASPTPVIEDDCVYLHFGRHGTVCLRAGGKSTEIAWKNLDLKYDHRHGPGGSPVIFEDLLILSCDGYDQQFVVALDKKSGAVRWRRPRQNGYQAYTTPLVIRAGDGYQVVSPGAHRAVAYEPRTGEELWSIDYDKGYSNVPRPVFAHGLVFICSGFEKASLFAVRPDGKGDVTASHVAWKAERQVSLTPSPIVVGDEFYMVSDGGIASCHDARTGALHWQERLGGNHSASPIFVDGRIYFLSEEGQSAVLKPGKKLEKLATNEIGERTLASMAVSGGAIFVRGEKHLYRLEQMGK